MDAHLVWRTWRTVLRSDELADAVLHPARHDLAALSDGDAEQRAVLESYAGDRAAADFTIGMYRNGLVRNALSALILAPLSRRLLYASGLDVDGVAADFIKTIQYRDDGPNFWRAAAAFVAFLGKLPAFASPVRQEAILFEAALIAHMRSLGQVPPAVWPAGAATEAAPACLSGRYVNNRACLVVTTGYDLTPWLEDTAGFDPAAELAQATHYWLVSVADAESAHTCAELSARAARAFNLLSIPRGAAELGLALGELAPAELLALLDSLLAIGALLPAQPATIQSEPSTACGLPLNRPAAFPETLPDHAFVMLDPAVEILDGEIAEYRLLCHSELEVGMAVPPGDGLLAFVAALSGQPAGVGALRQEFDDQELVDEMLASLRLHGFAHVTSKAAPSGTELAQLRSQAGAMRARTLRRSVVIDLDVPASLEQLCSQLKAGESAPEVLLCCSRLAPHGAVLAELAALRQAGRLRMHHTVLQTTDLECDQASRHALSYLGAAVHLAGVPWPVPQQALPGLAAMTRDRIAVHALMTPDLAILDETVRAGVLAWVKSACISGLCLQLDADALWPASNATEEQFLDLFNALRALEDECGDVLLTNLPSDEVMLGNTASVARIAHLSEQANRFRLAYLRWRLPFLKSCEGNNAWSQTPEVEEKLVRSQEDLLPNHPELLLLRPGSVVVDVCGGLGRVARRLAPAVAPDGQVISIEMLRLLSERARRFTYERNIKNVDFRPGLAQRIPLPDSSADAAVNEWTGAIWELGLGPAMVREMTRVVRLGGRIAVTHRLLQIPLAALGQPWIQYEEIYRWIRDAFVHPELSIVTERIWGQMTPSLIGENATLWRKQYMPRLVNPYDGVYEYDSSAGARADVFLTIIAQRQ
ncbi:MAG: methyltransferase domain-containing protein [Collimonas pratensis]|uniref:methyltransferase domain-containing protein n=1 Tax=Collimonas pratensis TaxID=279113 RepID=UPI003C74DA35